MALSETQIRAAKPQEKPYKLFDGGGLFLLVDRSGGRWWRLKYRFRGKERGISLGVYPSVPLKLARRRKEDAKRLLAEGIDPSERRRSGRLAQADTFQSIASEWLGLQSGKLAAVTLEKARWMLREFLLPKLGSRVVTEIAAPELLGLLRGVEEQGAHETAHRVKQLASRVFRYAIATGRAERDPTADLRGALAPVVTTNRAAITDPVRVGALMRAIEVYIGQPATHAALRLAPLVFVRPGELRAAEWREFDVDSAEWRIPAERMKMREPHLVPLSRQALAVLEDLRPLTGSGRYLFPSLRTPARPISENTLNAALRRLGYGSEEMTAHGFRAMASTLLNERGFAPDVIELQLAHAERNKVRAAYNRAQRLQERRQMMQDWANYLDGLRAGGKVVAIKRGKASR